MRLTRYRHGNGFGWEADKCELPTWLRLSMLLDLTRQEMLLLLETLPRVESYNEEYLSPVEDGQEVWAAGVTYLRSRVEREAESTASDVYAKVYDAERPELFFKSAGWRTVGHEERIRIRRDSAWNVPEPELTLVINRHLEIVGYTVGNDVSSRSIEGENPLYLPQAKSYDGSCAIGPSIELVGEEEMTNLPIHISIFRDKQEVFTGDANTSQIKRSLGDLVAYLGRETTFPHGVFLMTGTGIVPPHDFSLKHDDEVRIQIGELTLVNSVDNDFLRNDWS